MTEIFLGLLIGGASVWIGQFVRINQSFFFFAGFGDAWEPINKQRLGNRIGIILIILGIATISAPILMSWLGSVVIKAVAILAIVAVVLIISAIGLDQMGY